MEITEIKEICSRIADLTENIARFDRNEREVFTADKIEYKGKNNLVSYVDKRSEAMIVEELRKIIPDCDIIAEENYYGDNGCRYRWIIDPLDGTTNFIHGIPPYCISIALQEDGVTIAAIIREVTGDDLYVSWGEGTFFNGKKVTVSGIEKLEDSLAITGLAYNMTEAQKKDFVTLFDYFNRNSHGARRSGSAAMNLAYVARGAADLFYQANLSAWDVAAGAFLVQQAGGMVTDFTGGDGFLFGRNIIATNGHLHKQVRNIITQ